VESDLPAGRGSLKVSPAAEGDLWIAAGANGLFHSTDAGKHFTHVIGLPRVDGLGFGKAAPGHAYPALYAIGTLADVHGVYRSDDAGATWVRVNDDQHQYGSERGPITGDPRVYGRVYVGAFGRGIVYGEPITH